MDKKQIKSFNRNMSHIYSLVILNVMIFTGSLVLNYCHLNNNKFLYLGLAMNTVALILFKPWALMREVRELFACKRMLEGITQKKVEV